MIATFAFIPSFSLLDLPTENMMSCPILLLLAWSHFCCEQRKLYANAFEWSAGGRPEITRQAIAGLWKLTPPIPRPLKEFTVYPKSPPKDKSEEPELLILLKEDGSFQQYITDTEQDEMNASWQRYQKRKKLQEKESLPPVVKGIWGYQDGKLILAAERTREIPDTLLEGRVVATYETRATDDDDNTGAVPSSQVTSAVSKALSAKKTLVDTKLSVPQGFVHVGKFFYPTTHPSFFDQPMFRPEQRGGFQLRQILASVSNNPQDEIIEKFQRKNFYNKTFSLASFPIPTRKRKVESQWSKSKKAKQEMEDEQNRPSNIRVMHVKFFANNTFATVAGTGEAILRGKYDIIGQDRDQFWMQVVRFGFGRSVSGSVYSEGRMLSPDDAKAYWGTIEWEDSSNATTTAIAADAAHDITPVDAPSNTCRKLRVDGSVMFGFGLEPTPVGRFIMREIDEIDLLVTNDDEEDEDEDDMDNNDRERLSNKVSGDDDDTSSSDGIDWSAAEGFQ
jgi:hypothetical protein